VGFTRITVTVDDAHDVAAVADTLRHAGMEVEQVLSELAMVTGSVDANTVQALTSVEGVDSIDAAASVQLPPPDSDLQ
jgi:hypothetical protein